VLPRALSSRSVTVPELAWTIPIPRSRKLPAGTGRDRGRPNGNSANPLSTWHPPSPSCVKLRS
jgi:hypothetical protein